RSTRDWSSDVCSSDLTGLATEPLSLADPAVAPIAVALEARIRRLLGRALAIREVDAGSCNGCEIEVNGLTGPVYDMERFGMHFEIGRASCRERGDSDV